MLSWCESFLSDRHTYRSPRTRFKTGVAQGSPVSPVFYIFYNSDLLENCTNRDERTQATGYIEDTSIMVMGDSAEDNVMQLWRIHEQKAQPWAAKHASIFAPKKYQLMHFYSPHTGDHLDYEFSAEDLEEVEDEADREKYAPGPTPNLPGFRVRPLKLLKYLGVIFDPKLTSTTSKPNAPSVWLFSTPWLHPPGASVRWTCG